MAIKIQKQLPLATLLILLFLIQSPLNSGCKREITRNSASTAKWGTGKALTFNNMKRYARENGIEPPEITYVARHYGQEHRGEAETISATKKHLASLKQRLVELEEEMEPIAFNDPKYIRLFMELTALTGDHQLQLEALEMMEWESAWKLAYGKKEVIDSYPEETRHPIPSKDNPYPPKKK